jgi:hypothetical protein
MGRMVSDNGTTIHGGIIVMACVAGVFSILDVVVAGVSEAPVSHYLGEGRPNLPSPPDAVQKSSTESSIMAHSEVDDTLRVKPIKAAPSLPLLGKSLKPPK